MEDKTTATQKEKPKASFNVHKSQKELAEQKRLRNQRYASNLNERKRHWNSQNPNYEPSRKESMDKGKEKSKERIPIIPNPKTESQVSVLNPSSVLNPVSVINPISVLNPSSVLNPDSALDPDSVLKPVSVPILDMDPPDPKMKQIP